MSWWIRSGPGAESPAGQKKKTKKKKKSQLSGWAATGPLLTRCPLRTDWAVKLEWVLAQVGFADRKRAAHKHPCANRSRRILGRSENPRRPAPPRKKIKKIQEWSRLPRAKTTRRQDSHLRNLDMTTTSFAEVTWRGASPRPCSKICQQWLGCGRFLGFAGCRPSRASRSKLAPRAGCHLAEVELPCAQACTAWPGFRLGDDGRRQSDEGAAEVMA
ncbi:hypothetical protein B0T14DRAFT_312400 [Immersiella caudata]|uniref:Uncharacterized protein n=1 Tax=Immersiella caudata TaxID=314043 RepID=A0AA39WFZ8_9PEZI|nr:hypothetical protein B0T14DRAFT_312400 [Immersiella caudata]